MYNGNNVLGFGKLDPNRIMTAIMCFLHVISGTAACPVATSESFKMYRIAELFVVQFFL